MENRCKKCGGKLIEGYLTGAHILGFTPLEDENRLRPRYAKAVCEACVECGNIVNIRIEKPEKLRKQRI